MYRQTDTLLLCPSVCLSVHFCHLDHNFSTEFFMQIWATKQTDVYEKALVLFTCYEMKTTFLKGRFCAVSSFFWFGAYGFIFGGLLTFYLHLCSLSDLWMFSKHRRSLIRQYFLQSLSKQLFYCLENMSLQKRFVAPVARNVPTRVESQLKLFILW